MSYVVVVADSEKTWNVYGPLNASDADALMQRIEASLEEPDQYVEICELESPENAMDPIGP